MTLKSKEKAWNKMTWNDRKWERMNCASKSKCSWGEVYPDVQPTATLQRALKEAKGSSTIRSKAGLGSISPTEIKGWWWSSQPLYIHLNCCHEERQERQSHGSKDSTVRLSLVYLVSGRKSAWHCKFNFLLCAMSKTCHIAVSESLDISGWF